MKKYKAVAVKKGKRVKKSKSKLRYRIGKWLIVQGCIISPEATRLTLEAGQLVKNEIADRREYAVELAASL